MPFCISLNGGQDTENFQRLAARRQSQRRPPLRCGPSARPGPTKTTGVRVAHHSSYHCSSGETRASAGRVSLRRAETRMSREPQTLNVHVGKAADTAGPRADTCRPPLTFARPSVNPTRNAMDGATITSAASQAETTRSEGMIRWSPRDDSLRRRPTAAHGTTRRRAPGTVPLAAKSRKTEEKPGSAR